MQATTTVTHPYHTYTLEDALLLGARLCSPEICPIHPAPVPAPQALAAIEKERKECGFNWITGRVAAELLQAAITGRPHYTP